jgi:DNA-binding response OmpR family regulator
MKVAARMGRHPTKRFVRRRGIRREAALATVGAMKLLFPDAAAPLPASFKEILEAAGFDVDIIVAAAGGRVPAATKRRYPLVMIGPWLSPGERESLLRGFAEQPDAAPTLLFVAPAELKDGGQVAMPPRQYLLEAFQIEAVLTRLQALLRPNRAAAAPPLRLGNVTLDPSTGDVHIGGKPHVLPKGEAMVLAMLMQSPGRILAKELIETRLYRTIGEKSANAAEVRVFRLRRRLAAAGATPRIRTMRNVGYFIAC